MPNFHDPGDFPNDPMDYLAQFPLWRFPRGPSGASDKITAGGLGVIALAVGTTALAATGARLSSVTIFAGDTTVGAPANAESVLIGVIGNQSPVAPGATVTFEVPDGEDYIDPSDIIMTTTLPGQSVTAWFTEIEAE